MNICEEFLKDPFKHDTINCYKCNEYWNKEVLPNLGSFKVLRAMGVILDEEV